MKWARPGTKQNLNDPEKDWRDQSQRIPSETLVEFLKWERKKWGLGRRRRTVGRERPGAVQGDRGWGWGLTVARRVCSSCCRLRTWLASSGCPLGPASSASTASTSREAAAKAWVTSCTVLR